MDYLKTRLNSLRTQYTKGKGILRSGSEGLSTRRLRTVKKQIELLGFLEPHVRKRTSKTNMVSGYALGILETVNEDRYEMILCSFNLVQTLHNDNLGYRHVNNPLWVHSRDVTEILLHFREL